MLFFSFAFGLVAGFHRKPLAAWLPKVKWGLLAVVVILGVSTVVEYQLLSNATGEKWLGPYFGGFTRQVFAMVFILCFLAFDGSTPPFSEEITDLGSKSLGIYLAHNRLMFLAAILMYELTPRVLQYQFVYQLVLIVVALGGSVLLMELVKRSPAKPIYRYLFG
jgi:fucose 4-O-acetylase-like acetyltransferase